MTPESFSSDLKPTKLGEKVSEATDKAAGKLDSVFTKLEDQVINAVADIGDNLDNSKLLDSIGQRLDAVKLTGVNIENSIDKTFDNLKTPSDILEKLSEVKNILLGSACELAKSAIDLSQGLLSKVYDKLDTLYEPDAAERSMYNM